MAIQSLGDLATSTLFRTQNASLKAEMETLVQELASGQVSIRDTALGGSYRAISGIESSLTRLDAFDLAATEAEGFASAVQTALGDIQESTQDLSIDLLSAGTSATAAQAQAVSSAATQDFESIVARLNTNHAGRFVFGGVSTDTPPLSDASEMLEALETAVSGETTAAGVASVVEAWFSTGGAFETTPCYQGSTQPLAPMSVASDRSVSIEATAADEEIRNTLAGVALAVLIQSSAVSLSSDEQTSLANLAGEKLLNTNENLLLTRSEIGAIQESIEDAQSEAQSERSALDLALAELLTADPYDRATQLQQVESQIEMLYALTVRTSNLSLSNYL
ncbi:flagellin [Aliiruegeria sabulilitoris]|uniref:flagellin n=1 Tax=Aliiruegeria sabulilitoris TaxID=1510458 RepID=UPI000831B417|nr:flagellin [Aliiruegeria sabulilitoris]NDR57613.1 hypothetical protein [Pseudoruegeria sp. M32A2M]